MAAAVFVDVAAEAGSPGGVVQSVSVAEEAHPVADRTLIVALASFFAAAFQNDVAGFAVDRVNAGRCTVSSDNATGYTVGFKFLRAVCEVDNVLFRNVYIDVCVSEVEGF